MPRIDPNNWFKRAIVRGMREAAKKGRLRLVEEPWAQFARAVRFEEAGRRLDAKRRRWKRGTKEGGRHG